jgi:hypothetical protein
MMKLFRRSSRKAWLFNLLMVIFTIVILTYAFIRINEKQSSVKMQIGENPLTLVTKMQEGEKAMIFLDFAAKLAVYQSIHDLEEEGGISEESRCGSYYGFNRWNSEAGESCFVDARKAKDSLRDLFVSNLVARMAAYPNADFIGNLPAAAFARGEALAATYQAGVSVAPSAAPQQPEEGAEGQLVLEQRVTEEEVGEEAP